MTCTLENEGYTLPKRSSRSTCTTKSDVTGVTASLYGRIIIHIITYKIMHDFTILVLAITTMLKYAKSDNLLAEPKSVGDQLPR